MTYNKYHNEKRIKVNKLFEQGNFKLAFFGGDDFFWEDAFWGDHSTSGVFYNFFNWIDANKLNDKLLTKVKQDFTEGFKENLNTISSLDEGSWSICVLRSYILRAGYESFWPIDKKYIINLLKNTLYKLNKETLVKNNIIRDINTLKEYIPELKEVVRELEEKNGP